MIIYLLLTHLPPAFFAKCVPEPLNMTRLKKKQQQRIKTAVHTRITNNCIEAQFYQVTSRSIECRNGVNELWFIWLNLLILDCPGKKVENGERKNKVTLRV